MCVSQRSKRAGEKINGHHSRLRICREETERGGKGRVGERGGGGNDQDEVEEDLVLDLDVLLVPRVLVLLPSGGPSGAKVRGGTCKTMADVRKFSILAPAEKRKAGFPINVAVEQQLWMPSLPSWHRETMQDC